MDAYIYKENNLNILQQKSLSGEEKHGNCKV